MTNVLLTGAGGAVIPGLIEHLRSSGYRVFAADMDRYAVGLYFADQGFVIPAGASHDFLPVLREICLQNEINVVVPLVDEELLSASALESDGVIVLLPRQEFVSVCLDKYLLMQHLEAANIPAPNTRLAGTGLETLTFPLVIKPRRGRGSRGLGIVKSEKELELFLKNSAYSAEDLIVQEYIDGTEFTVSVVVWRDGEVQAVVPKEVVLKRGITHLAVTRRSSEIERVCHEIQEKLRADGPFNVQLRINRNTGKATTFEINPRFSTTISLTIAAGVDELGGLIIQAMEGKEKYRFGNWKESVFLLRRTLDTFIDETDFHNRHPVYGLVERGLQ